MAQHTPGPWYLDPLFGLVCFDHERDGSLQIARVTDSVGDPSASPDAYANERWRTYLVLARAAIAAMREAARADEELQDLEVPKDGA